MGCRFCEKSEVEYWFGNWCESCRKIKNLGNVYGFERVLEILERCCIRNPKQIDNKIVIQKTLSEVEQVVDTKRNTRSSVKKL